MAADNVDIFKKVIFRIPSARKSILAMIVLGFIYAAVFQFGLRVFTQIALTYFLIPVVAIVVFIIPFIAPSEIFHRVLPDYPRHWSFFLGLSNQLILFVYSLILTGANNLQSIWQIIWLAAITLFLSNFFVIILSIGPKKINRIGLTSSLSPVLVLGAFHLALGRYLEIPLSAYVWNSGTLLVAGVALIVTIYTFEYLMGSNVRGISVLDLTAGLLQNRQEKLDLGYFSRPEVQTIQISNSTGTTTLAVPWIHPGPLQGFGGGKVTSWIIEHLNTDGEGFFLHVPSTHESDLANPGDAEKLVEALEEPELKKKASKMIRRDYDMATFYGRLYGDKKVVYMDCDQFDDYEVGVFKEMLDLENTVIVDLHCHREDTDNEEREELWYDTVSAERIREELTDFLEELEAAEIHDYHAGFHTENSETPVFSLVEEVDCQRTLIFGIETNGTSKEIQELKDELAQKYDHCIVFSTDTHESIHDMASGKNVDLTDIDQSVDEAENRVSTASAGMEMKKAEPMKLLNNDYNSLVHSINIIIRMIPLTLLLMYILLILWVL